MSAATRRTLLVLVGLCACLLTTHGQAELPSDCQVSISLLQGAGRLGTDDTNCTLLADLAAQYFAPLADVQFTCYQHTTTTLDVCAPADPDMASSMLQYFQIDPDSVHAFYFFVPFDISVIDYCTYPNSDDPNNQKGVALTNMYTNEYYVSYPPVADCFPERPPAPEDLSPPDSPLSPPPAPPAHCKDGRTTITLRGRSSRRALAGQDKGATQRTSLEGSGMAFTTHQRVEQALVQHVSAVFTKDATGLHASRQVVS